MHALVYVFFFTAKTVIEKGGFHIGYNHLDRTANRVSYNLKGILIGRSSNAAFAHHVRVHFRSIATTNRILTYAICFELAAFLGKVFRNLSTVAAAAPNRYLIGSRRQPRRKSDRPVK